jgi:hypothetical protein
MAFLDECRGVRRQAPSRAKCQDEKGLCRITVFSEENMDITPKVRELHERSIIIDGLNASRWGDEEVYRHLREGGVTAINATLAVWDEFKPTMQNIGRNASMVCSGSCKSWRSARADWSRCCAIWPHRSQS